MNQNPPLLRGRGPFLGPVRAVCLLLFAVSCNEGPLPGGDGMFRGGPEHRGVYEAANGEHGAIAWSFLTGGAVRGSALVDSEFVYIGSGDGNFYAIERESGQEAWRFEAGSAIHSSAAAAGSRVFFGDRANAYYALDRRSGRLLWKVQTAPDVAWEWGHEGWDYFTSSPIIVGDVVVVGSGDGNVYAFDAGNGAERWRLATGGRVRSSPAVANGVVYVGSADGLLYAIDLESGNVAWRFETEGASYRSAEFSFDRKTIQASPAIADGVVYFGSRDGKFYALDAGSGVERWRYDHTAAWVVSSAAISQGLVIVGTSDGLHVHALNLDTGEETWRFETAARVFSSPAVSGTSAYVGVHDGRLLSLDAASGEPQWALYFTQAVMSSPVVDDGHLYVGCDDGAVRSIRLQAGPPAGRGVYWDADRVARNTQASHEQVRDYFLSVGYQLLDRTQLAKFMEESTRAAARSVVVFAMDDLPSVDAVTLSDTTLVRRYLDGGGKIVWLGLPPLLLERDGEGNVVGFDRARPQQLLGVNHERYNMDRWASYPTEAGKRWGFRECWMSVSGIEPREVTTVLAMDGTGGAAAWVKSFGGPVGTGFVSLWGSHEPIPAKFFEQIRDVAEYGIGVVPAP